MSEILSNFKDIIPLIPEVLLYFFTGYLFLSCYHVTSLSDKENEAEHLIIKCIAISYLFSLFLNVTTQVFPNIQREYQLIILAIVAMLLGLCIGRIRRTAIVASIIEKINGGDLREDARVDIIELARGGKQMWAVFRISESKEVFQGQIDRIIGSKDDPIFVLYCCERVIEASEGTKYERFDEASRLFFKFSLLDRVEIKFKKI